MAGLHCLPVTSHARGRRGIMPGSPQNRANEALNRVVATGEWGTVIPKGDLSQLGRHRCSLLSQFAGVEHQPNLGVGVDPVRVEWLVAAADGAL